MGELELRANEEKELVIRVDGKKYARVPIKTHVFTPDDTIPAVVKQYVVPVVQPGDIVFFSEKAVACTQKRAIPIKDIHPRWLARTLSKFVYKNPAGRGLGLPETMEMTMQLVGAPRVLFAGMIGLVGKLFGKRGWFYNVAGEAARSIDTPDDYTIPPYNECIILAPENPDKVASEAAEVAGVPVAIIDVNDIGGNILGLSDETLPKEWLVKLLKDNPLGQAAQSTPIGIIREIKE